MSIQPEDLDSFTDDQLYYLYKIWLNDLDDDFFSTVAYTISRREALKYDAQTAPVRIVNKVDRLKPRQLSADLPVRMSTDYTLGNKIYHDAIEFQTMQRHLGSRRICVWCTPTYKNMD